MQGLRHSLLLPSLKVCVALTGRLDIWSLNRGRRPRLGCENPSGFARRPNRAFGDSAARYCNQRGDRLKWFRDNGTRAAFGTVS